MQYILFHKNTKVANIELSQHGLFQCVNGYYNEQLMPPGTRGFPDSIITKRFEKWLNARFVPIERENVERLLHSAHCMSTDALILKNYALSLNDCYWIKSVEVANSKPFWEDINFFMHPDNGYVSEFLLYGNSEKNEDFNSPNLTLSGMGNTAWFYKEDGIFLYKQSLAKYNHIDAINSIISAKLCDILGIKTPDISLENLKDGKLYTKSKCFTDEKTEFFPFSMLSIEKNTSGRHGILEFIRKNNLQDELNKYIVHDYILNVSNRDFSNLGYTRDSETLNITGLAPLFSNGKCLEYNISDAKTDEIFFDKADTFELTHTEQLRLIKDFSFIDFYKLGNFPEIILNIYKEHGIPMSISSSVIKRVEDRITKLANLANIDDAFIDISIGGVNSITLNNTHGSFSF